MKKFKITDKIFNELSSICDVCKLDWFYPSYIKRKTIDFSDLDAIADHWLLNNCKPEISDDTKNLFKLLGYD